jgi:hypothetical protein
MKRKNSLRAGLTMALLFGTAWTLTALPGPEDYKKTVEDAKKAAATPTPRGVVPGPDDFKKTADDVKKATASSNAGTLPTAPAPEDVNKAVEAAKGNPAQSSNAPYQFYDRYTDGSQRRDPLPTTWNTRYQAGSQQSTSNTGDWHKKNKKNKKKHHDDNQDQANSTYDGSPILYNKPKPTSDTEDWHKKNKNEHHHHEVSNSTYDGSPILYNKPKPTSDQQWNKTAGDAQGRFSVGFDPIKSSAPQTQTSQTSKLTENSSVMADNDDHPGKHKNKHKHGHHHDDDQGNH